MPGEWWGSGVLGRRCTRRRNPEERSPFRSRLPVSRFARGETTKTAPELSWFWLSLVRNSEREGVLPTPIMAAVSGPVAASASPANGLWQAAAAGSTAAVRACLDKGDPADQLNEQGTSALYSACQMGHTDVVKLLLARGATADRPNAGSSGVTPLLISCSNGHQECVVALLKAGASANQPDAAGFSPLYICCGKGHAECMKALLAHGAATEVPESKGASPLYVAAQYGHAECVALLIGAGAALDAFDKKNGQTALYTTCWRGHAKCAALLLAAKANCNLPEAAGATPLYVASQHGRAHCVQALLGAGADPYKADGAGFSPLYVAAAHNALECVKLLIVARAPVAAATPSGATPLHVACQEGHAEVTRVLLAAGASPNAQDGGWFTPLYLACLHKRPECAASLIAAGAFADLARPNGATALHVACEAGHAECAALLLASHASPDSQLADGATPLMLASAEGHGESVAILLTARADVEQTRFSGCNGERSPIEAARSAGHDLVVTLLEAKRASPWKQQTMQAAAKLAATAGLRVQRLARIEGLRTRAGRVGCLGASGAGCIEGMLVTRRCFGYLHTVVLSGLLAVSKAVYVCCSGLVGSVRRGQYAAADAEAPGAADGTHTPAGGSAAAGIDATPTLPTPMGYSPAGRGSAGGAPHNPGAARAAASLISRSGMLSAARSAARGAAAALSSRRDPAARSARGGQREGTPRPVVIGAGAANAAGAAGAAGVAAAAVTGLGLSPTASGTYSPLVGIAEEGDEGDATVALDGGGVDASMRGQQGAAQPVSGESAPEAETMTLSA